MSGDDVHISEFLARSIVAPTGSGAVADLTDDEVEFDYNHQVGARLRAVRRWRQPSLLEAATHFGRIGAVALGSYERGEHSMSMSRLEQFARFYGLPIDRFLPQDAIAQDLPVDRSPMVLDLAVLHHPDCPHTNLVEFVRALALKRQDFNGLRFAVRSSDRWALAAMLDIPIDQLLTRLAALGLLIH